MRVAILAAVSSLSLFGAGGRIADAMKERDTATFRALLQKHEDVNAAQGDGATALHWAAHWNDLDAASQLLRAGARVNAADDEGVTPLALAALNANAAMVDLLLEAGADVNLVRTNGETPLMTAAMTGDPRLVRLLLTHGAKVNKKENFRGQTALMRAVAESHPEAVQALIESGADVKARSTNRFTALLFAAQQGTIDCARLLLAAGADVNDTAPDGIGGDTNARILFKPDTEAGALLVAIDSGHPDMAKFLLENGADPNQHGAGRTPLHASVQHAMPEMVSALLAKGANPNARLEKPLPVLSRFIHQDSGMEVDPVGATPFWLAASFTDLKIMKILSDAGADTKMVSRDKTTPLMVAAGVDFVDGQDKYGRRWFTDSMPLQLAAIEATKLCLSLGNDINAVNANGQTAMHGAAYFGSTILVNFLFEHGAKLNAENILGQTPYLITQGLYLAGSFTVRREAGELLVKLGADPKIGADNPYAHINGADVKAVADAKAAMKALREK
jgi:ankyrin repeat protein